MEPMDLNNVQKKIKTLQDYASFNMLETTVFFVKKS